MPSARLTHPVTGARFYVRAASRKDLAGHVAHVDDLRERLRLGRMSVLEVSSKLCRLRFGPMTLGTATRRYLERPKLSPETRRRMRSLLATHFAPLEAVELDALTRPRMVEWIEALQRAGLEQSSIAQTWRCLASVERYAWERGWIAACPWGDWFPNLRGSKSIRVREAARTVEELDALLRAANALDLARPVVVGRVPSAIEAKCAVAALLGLRQGELAGLRWDDWTVRREGDDGARIYCNIERQWDGRRLKSPRGRVETIWELWRIVDVYRERLARAGGFALDGAMFPRELGPDGPRHYASGEVLTRLEIRAAVGQARLPHVEAWSAHSLRDTFVTLESSASGGDLAHVAARSGHGSLATLARYLRASSREPAPLLTLPGKRSGAGPSVPGDDQ